MTNKDVPYKSKGRNRHLKEHAQAYNDLKDRVLIKTYLHRPPCVPQRHEA